MPLECLGSTTKSRILLVQNEHGTSPYRKTRCMCGRERVTETRHPVLFLDNLLFNNDLDGSRVRYRRNSGIFTVNMSTM